MKQFPCLLVLLISLANFTAAQLPADSVSGTADSLVQGDSIPVAGNIVSVPAVLDVSKRPLFDTGWVLNPPDRFPVQSILWQILEHHPYFGFHLKPVRLPAVVPLSEGEPRQSHGKEWLFYSLILLVILFALLRRAFPKYFNDLFRLFFRTTLKERQISEQLMQSPVPSILLNGFFTVSAGFYCSFLLEHFGLNPAGNFWALLLYCTGGLAGAYFIKFIGLKISGWVFNMKGAANSYIFIVFIINKMIGILLLPFLLVLAFSSGNIYTIGLTLSWCLVGVLLIYRLFLTYTIVRNQVKVSPFHFFLYFLAFEIAPLLLVYKALLVYFS
ncbi:MAG: DUF4271 domain-containing protein [Sphingobacteriales bacterium]|nr:DUF4271 domain-containing protein [Sphingobacteriales bacterium]